MRVPAIVIAIPLLIGIVAGVLLVDGAPERWAFLSAAVSLFAVVAAAGGIAERRAVETCVALVLAPAAAGLSLGLTAARDAYRQDRPFTLGEPTVLEGVLREDALVTEGGVSLTLGVADDDVGIRLGVGGGAAAARADEWRAGRRLRVTATLRQPATYLNFGVPDEARALARRGVVLVGSVKSAALVEVVEPEGAIEAAAASARAWARRTLARHVGALSARSAAIAAAILIGDRSGIAEEDERRLQEAGTYHVIAISGGNIAILTALLMSALRGARVSTRLAPALTIVALLFYGELTRAPPSVARAISAAVVFLAARVIDHRGPPLNALAVAGGVALAASPLTAFDAGFILSFGATTAILVGLPRLLPARPERRSPRLIRALRHMVLAALALLAATVCAEAALIPVGASLFARVTFAGLLLNFAAIPLMTAVQIGGLLTLAAAPVSSEIADAAALMTHLAAAGLVDSARLVDVVPMLAVDVIPPAWWLIALYYAACVALLLRGRIRSCAALTLAAGLVLMLTSPACAQRGADIALRPRVLRVVFLDVGQADATLVQLPGGRNLLVDAAGLPGSTLDAGERIVAPALRAFGVKRLETLVVTHGDPDHMGGALSVARRFHPRVVWEGVPVPRHDGLRALADLAAARRAVWREVRAGDTERIDGVAFTVWHPPAPDWERQRVRNDDSIVLEVRYGDVSFLLTGDIERQAERALAPRLQLAPLVVLKAPHHGSATSSSQALLDAVRPAVAVISAGRRNLFGHPHPAVLARYRGAGAAILRTDEDGAVVVESDGKGIYVQSYTGRRFALSR